MKGFNCIEENTGRGICIFFKEELEIKEHDNLCERFNLLSLLALRVLLKIIF